MSWLCRPPLNLLPRDQSSKSMVMRCRETDLKRYIENAVEVDPDRPVLVDKYLDRADELDVDALCDKDGNVTICGIMQHIEQAGVHSGEPSLSPVF